MAYPKGKPKCQILKGKPESSSLKEEVLKYKFKEEEHIPMFNCDTEFSSLKGMLEVINLNRILIF